MIFVDCGPLLARQLRRDQHRTEALAEWQRLGSRSEPLCTSVLVIVEFMTLMARRVGIRIAVEQGRNLYSSTDLKILRTDELVESQALIVMQKHADQNIGFVDCTSFVLMQTHGIKTAFTFDQHFTDAGFDVVPS